MCGRPSEALYAFAGARWTVDGDTDPIFCEDCRQFPSECLYVSMWTCDKIGAWRPRRLHQWIMAPSRLLLAGKHADHVVRGLWWEAVLIGPVLVLAAYAILGRYRYWWAAVAAIVTNVVCITYYRIKSARADWRTYKSRWP